MKAIHSKLFNTSENFTLLISHQEQEYLVELLKEQHETERSELAYRLKLEQDEETEKLRKVCVLTDYDLTCDYSYQNKI